jgi:hypothetical protein
MKADDLGGFAWEATLAAHEDNTLLGNVLAVGARLVSEGSLPQDVVDEEPGAFALCLVTRMGGEVRVLHGGDVIEVGRSPDAAAPCWKVDDPWMSRRHFRVSVDAAGYPWLHGQGAKNGTFVNDRAIEDRSALRRGDVIRAGSSSFLLL